VWTIIIGFVIGLLARALKPGNDRMGLIMTTILGIAGALLAKFVGMQLGWYAPNQPAGFIASVVGAILLLLLFGLARRRA
ncbi:MAG TPA: GlsB/YeaQ/YmgE family stress response membrane protein, partial [Polyangiaceae bacterium]